MAPTIETTGAKDHRGFLVTALVVLGGATGAAFGRVFQGRPASLRLVAAGAIAVILAELLRRRNVLLSIIVSALGLLVTLALFVFPGTTWGGLPTLDTMRALGDALGSLGREAAREVAPAPALPSLMTASITAVWAAAAAAHALAVRSRSTILPLLPPAALLAFAGVVREDGPRPGYASALLLAGAAVLLGVGIERLGLWGRVVHRPTGRRRRLLGVTTARRAGWIAAGGLFVATVLPGILPGYASGSIIDLEGRGGESITVSPIVDIRPSLRQNPARLLFTVEADRPAYWRLVVLDRFDGRLWTATDAYAEQGEQIGGSGDLVTSPLDGEELTQTFEIQDLATSWLPAAFEPERVTTGSDEGLRYDPTTDILVRPEGVTEGFVYEVVSDLPTPTVEELDQADRTVGSDMQKYLELPGDLPPAISAQAQAIVDRAGAATPYDQVLAIQEHLRTFAYDDAIPPGHGNRDIVEFLVDTQKGYCEQFAGTMAVLVRALGIPARVAVGFQAGTVLAPGRFQVHTKDAHAWPEVFFGDLGWIPFEPTPSRNNPVGGYLGLGGVGTVGTDGGPAPPTQEQQGGPGRGQRDQGEGRAATADREAAATLPEIRVPTPEPPFPWVGLVLALLVTVGVVMVFAAVAKAIFRSAALRRAGPPDHAVTRAYVVFQASAADLGLARRAAETLGEYRDRLLSSVRFSDGHLERLTALTGTAVYGARPMTEEEGRGALDAARALGRDLRRHAGPLRRAMGAVRPSLPF
jgi:transglutaminase-like putative cysteine protease